MNKQDSAEALEEQDAMDRLQAAKLEKALGGERMILTKEPITCQ